MLTDMPFSFHQAFSMSVRLQTIFWSCWVLLQPENDVALITCLHTLTSVSLVVYPTCCFICPVNGIPEKNLMQRKSASWIKHRDSCFGFFNFVSWKALLCYTVSTPAAVHSLDVIGEVQCGLKDVSNMSSMFVLLRLWNLNRIMTAL